MRVIVTGATSFIGSAVTDLLNRQGHEVIAFRHSFEEEPDRLPSHADVWLHFAWAGKGSQGRSDPDIQSFNVAMTEAALKKAAELGCGKFVFAGSQAEYGHAQDGTLKREDGEVLPVSAYGRAKLEVLKRAEKLISGFPAEKGMLPMDYVHMRLFSVYGPGDHETSLIQTLIRGFAEGKTVDLGPCRQLWNYMYIDDAAAAIVMIAEKAGPGIINVAGSDNRPLSAFVSECHEALGSRGSVIFGTRPDNAEGPADLAADISRLTGLGFDAESTVSFEEGIRKSAGICLR